MAAYTYIPNGQRVECADGKPMPPALFAPVEEPKKKQATKRTTKPKGE